MGLLSSLIRTTVDVVVLPVRVVVDVLTLPASAEDPKRGPFDNTTEGLTHIKDDLIG
jgi:hypothetical protein